jgi:hypothetical protein
MPSLGELPPARMGEQGDGRPRPAGSARSNIAAQIPGRLETDDPAP